MPVDISRRFLERDSLRKSRKEVKKDYFSVISRFSPRILDTLKQNRFKGVKFLARSEDKTRGGLNDRLQGTYDIYESKAYVFPVRVPRPSYLTHANINRERGRDALRMNIAHELGHAVSVPSDDLTSRAFDRFERLRGKLERKYGTDRKNYITDYAASSSFEDFADSFAFYAMHKKKIDRNLKKRHKRWASGPVRAKLAFMRDEIW